MTRTLTAWQVVALRRLAEGRGGWVRTTRMVVEVNSLVNAGLAEAGSHSCLWYARITEAGWREVSNMA